MHQGGVLVQSKEVRMKPDDVIRIFQSDYYAAAANRGKSLGGDTLFGLKTVEQYFTIWCCLLTLGLPE